MPEGAIANAPRAPASPAKLFAIVSLGVALATIDQFIVNVAFASIGRDLGSDLATLSWVLNAYSIIFAALLVPAGRLADRSGRKLGFLSGIAVFTLASALCAGAVNVEMLIASRCLQAVGAALLTPSSLGLLLAAYPPEKRAWAVRRWTAVIGSCAALGPVAGGLLTQVDWRLIFLINIPLGLIGLVAGIRNLPGVAPVRGPFPDLLGSALLAAGIGLLTLGLSKAHDWSFGSWQFAGSATASAVLIAAFFLRSSRHPSPVVELSLLRVPRFAISTAATLIYSAAFSAMLLSLILWGQVGWGWGALRSALALAPGPLMVPLFSILSGRVIARIGAGMTAVIGCSVFAAGALTWLGWIDVTPNYASGMLAGMFLTGIGVGLTLPTLIGVGASSLPPDRFATGSGVMNTARQLGFTIGIAVLIAVLGSAGEVRSGGQLDSFRHSWATIAILSLIAGGVASLLLRRGTREALA